MRGEILSYDSVSGEGLISGDDLLRYRFSRLDVGGAQEPAPGLRVDFVPLDAASVAAQAQSSLPPLPQGSSTRTSGQCG